MGMRTPEFNHMSLRPGIGFPWLRKFVDDVYPRGKVVARGKEANAPRYYDKVYGVGDPLGLEELKTFREFEALPFRFDGSAERLQVRELVAKARLSTLKRSLDE